MKSLTLNFKASFFSSKTFVFLAVVVLILFAIAANPPLYGVFRNVPTHIQGTNFDGFNIQILACLILSYAVTWIFGYSILRPWAESAPSHRLTQWIASFFIGFLGLIGLSRLLSLFLISTPLYLAVAFSSLALAFLPLYKRSTTAQLTDWNIWTAARILLSSGIFLALILILQVGQAEFVWVGHGSGQYAVSIPQWQAEWIRFPLVLQHHDELLYHYWGTLLFPHYIDPILPWWITLALVKLSMFCFIYTAFRKFNISPIFSFVFTLFLFIGTLSPLFTKYYLVFDSSNSLFYTVHSGRIVGIGVALLLLTEFVLPKEQSTVFRNPALLFVALGLATTSLSNSLWAVCMVLFFLFHRQIASLGKGLFNRSTWASRIHWLAPLVVILSVFMYPFWVQKTPWMQLRLDLVPIYFRLIACLLLLGFFARAFLSQLNEMPLSFQKNSASSGPILFLIASLAGILFLGNITAFPFLRFLSQFPNLNLPRILKCSLKAAIELKPGAFIGDYRELENWNQYCFSAFHMAAYYGTFLLIFLVANNLIVRRLKPASPLRELLPYFYLYLVSFPSLLFFIEYTSITCRAWVKTRFIEIPVYLILFISFYFMYHLLQKREKTVLIVVIVAYCILPFYFTERPQVMRRNAHILQELISQKKPPNFDRATQTGP